MISQPYTLFTRICIFRNEKGEYYADQLWEQDLSAHFDYIADLRLCCPVDDIARAKSGAVKIDKLSDAQVIPLRRDGGWLSVARNLVPNFISVRRALKTTKIAHSGGAGWAFPLSYYILILRWFMSFQWIIVIESSFWMKPKTGKVSVRQYVGHFFHLRMIRACVRSADARIFTQDWYRATFLGHKEASLIAPAVWVTADQIIAPDQVVAEDPVDHAPLRFLFAARLVKEKGVETVLSAIEMLEAAGADKEVTVDIIGKGVLADRCRAFCNERADSFTSFLEPVPYGAPFFDLVRSYDALIVANMQDEQPRIVFDANSQGVPCIVTRTEGLKDLVIEGETGYQCDVGDADGLAAIIQKTSIGELPLRALRPSARAFASNNTHEAMHKQREVFLIETLALSPKGTADQEAG